MLLLAAGTQPSWKQAGGDGDQSDLSSFSACWSANVRKQEEHLVLVDEADAVNQGRTRAFTCFSKWLPPCTLFSFRLEVEAVIDICGILE